VDLDESDPEKGRCVRCDRFDGFPCLTDGKADAHVLCVRPAIKNDNVRLLTHAKVEKLVTDSSGGAVSEVVVDRRGARESYSGDVVVVSCGAINSAALLLRSASDEHPGGLANSSDVVGRNYMAHINSGVIAISQTPNTTKFQKTLGVNDYYWGANDSELPLGHIQMLGKSDRNILRAGAPWYAPGQALDYMSKHAIDFWITTEDLPNPTNRVSVDRAGQIHVSKRYYNLDAHKRLLAKLKGLLGELGCRESPIPGRFVLDQRIPLAGVAHQCGTVRFGTDPADSALDVNCKAHDLDNLYVVDTSFFPSSSAVNPALTAMANALRVGDHLLERLGVSADAARADNGRPGTTQPQEVAS
jgi:choline dehydrogenase-like flavoprotein